ncbi:MULTISPECIES: glycosyltransferase family 4 protein [unclassified Dolichospermum]|uniref:glycosyltransferase family 4 protein n=1 Tax=unclassified Dolichospermum TaxID=2622029 RepID=UPI001444CFC6|nr:MULTISPECIES: glycosyltransferase family 4 protein [unclassified Dolichospermum]MTJ15657.1 glycosyltransferase family 4 protein [Dolichospermum sp. UHCC 0299]MTJ23044.1 glycosyltransferase family 4 protein [Dolichospermum sp. UHCC 0352]MTJ41586.1 glycosyltransferase family 4 protein [Dolichospermum sp. UHCC 0406]
MKTPFRLGVVFTHPTQHHGPLWKKLNEQAGLSVKVFYLCNENQASGDVLLGGNSQPWDVDLLSGYEYDYLKDFSGRVPSEQKKNAISPELFNSLTLDNLDAIFMQSFVNYSYRLTALLCKLRGIPLIMQNDATIMSDCRYSRSRQIMMAILYPWMLNLADYWLSCGDHNEIHLRHYGVADEKIVRGCHPVDGERFEQSIRQNQDEIRKIRRDLSWNEDTLIYGFAGKYIERKNPFEFIEAIEKAHQRDPRVRGIMIGGGDLESEINQRLSQLRNGEVINLGFVNQTKIPLYYAAMDVFVVTSWIDPHPLVVSEAMVSGCPPILSDRCGNWGYNDTVRHCYNGLVYPCGNSDVLADRMLEMIDIETRKQYSTKSKEVFYGQDIYCEVKAFLKVIERIKQGVEDSYH